MKKFIALIVVLCTVMISSTAAADNFTANSQIICLRRVDDFYYRFTAREEAERQRLKDEQARQEEFYRLVFTVALTTGLIVLFFAYNYFRDRQLVRERSFATWLLSFAGMKNFWILIFLRRHSRYVRHLCPLQSNITRQPCYHAQDCARHNI